MNYLEIPNKKDIINENTFINTQIIIVPKSQIL
jgi:hypothetical protein